MWTLRLVACAILLFAGWLSPTWGYIRLPKEPVPNKVAVADCVGLGKITALRKKPVKATLFPSQDKKENEFTIVEVEITENLAGLKEKKQILLGFIGIVSYTPAPKVGVEGCFFAIKHWDEDFYVVPQGCWLEKSDKEFEEDLKLARRSVLALNDPLKSLKAKDASDRALAAYVLALRYSYTGIRMGGKSEGKKIDAEVSKLILLGLADAWDKPDPKIKASPQHAMGWLAWGARMTRSPVPEASEAWLRANAETYRIVQIVPTSLKKK